MDGQVPQTCSQPIPSSVVYFKHMLIPPSAKVAGYLALYRPTTDKKPDMFYYSSKPLKTIEKSYAPIVAARSLILSMLIERLRVQAPHQNLLRSELGIRTRT